MNRQERLQVGKKIQGREILAVTHTAIASTILARDGDDAFAVQDWYQSFAEASNGWYRMSFAHAQRRFLAQAEHLVYWREVLTS